MSALHFVKLPLIVFSVLIFIYQIIFLDQTLSSSRSTCFMQENSWSGDVNWYPTIHETYFKDNSLCFVENFEMKDGPYLHELSKVYDGDWGNPIFWIDEYPHYKNFLLLLLSAIQLFVYSIGTI